MEHGVLPRRHRGLALVSEIKKCSIACWRTLEVDPVLQNNRKNLVRDYDTARVSLE